jgi:hypothetical protein
VLRPEDLAVGLQDLGLLLEDEDHRPPRSDHREGLERSVEDQRSSQRTTLSVTEMIQAASAEAP